MHFFSAAILCLGVYPHPESDIAIRDRLQFPPEVQPYLVYLSTSSVQPEHREKLTKVLQFVVPSLSSKPFLQEQIPQPIKGTNLLRINMDELGWATAYPLVLEQQYVPTYRPDLKGTKGIPLVIDGLWFAAAVVDPIETGDAQYQLIYSGKVPKTADEFLNFWGIQNEADYVFGLIEGQSGVSVQKVRLIENRPGAKRNFGWLTRDSAKIAGEKDPLENLPNKAKFDAQELIVCAPKWKGGKSGTLQYYFLAEGGGKRQEKAPADVVTNHTGIRGVEIRNTVHCIACHQEGINPPTSDEFRTYVTSGATVSFLDKNKQRATDQYLNSDIQKEVQHNQESYADGISLCNGLKPLDNAKAFIEVVQLYDAPVTLEQAAREVHLHDARELQLALANYSRKYTLTGRLALLSTGKSISREQWKASYSQAQEIVYLWNDDTFR